MHTTTLDFYVGVSILAQILVLVQQSTEVTGTSLFLNLPATNSVSTWEFGKGMLSALSSFHRVLTSGCVLEMPADQDAHPYETHLNLPLG